MQQIEENENEVSVEIADKVSKVKLVHVKRQNIEFISLDKHLSDLHYSGNIID